MFLSGPVGIFLETSCLVDLCLLLTCAKEVYKKVLLMKVLGRCTQNLVIGCPIQPVILCIYHIYILLCTYIYKLYYIILCIRIYIYMHITHGVDESGPFCRPKILEVRGNHTYKLSLFSTPPRPPRQ